MASVLGIRRKAHAACVQAHIRSNASFGGDSGSQQFASTQEALQHAVDPLRGGHDSRTNRAAARRRLSRSCTWVLTPPRAILTSGQTRRRVRRHSRQQDEQQEHVSAGLTKSSSRIQSKPSSDVFAVVGSLTIRVPYRSAHSACSPSASAHDSNGSKSSRSTLVDTRLRVSTRRSESSLPPLGKAGSDSDVG